MKKELCITSDFVDDLLFANTLLTESHLDAIMQYSASLGATRFEWVLYANSNVYEAHSPLGYDLLKAACAAAHRHGMRFDAVYKPFETGLAAPVMSVPHSFPHSETDRVIRNENGMLHSVCKTLMTVGAYIDLNPVRAGIADEPDEYRWSGYGTAVRGSTLSRKGLRPLVAAAYSRRDVSFETASEAYTSAIDGFIEILPPEVIETPDAACDKPVVKEALPRVMKPQVFVPERVEQEIAKGAKLSLFEMLRCKVRYLKPSKDTSRPYDCCDDVERYNARGLRGDDKVSVPKDRVA